MTDLQIIEAPTHVTHHARARRASIADRLQAAFGAFVAPEKFAGTAPPVSNDNSDAISFADPLALPPGWHGSNGNDLLSLSFLPFDR